VIIDSPWQTSYNTFQVNEDYSDLAGLVSELHASGIRVLLWATPFINVSSNDGPGRAKASNYDAAHAANYFVDNGRTFEWDKGQGSAIDFFNPDAVRWLYGQMDQAFSTGIDGWKVDSPEGNLPARFQTAAGLKTEREYGEAYYRAFYQYVVERNPDAITFARATDSGTVYAPVDVNPAGWAGDQNPSWAGLREAFDDTMLSSQYGFSMLGFDIGGYRRGERSQKVFLRWAQFGALVPLMENGGRGEHRPWLYGSQGTEIYRYYAKLHHELVPYLYSAGVEAHRTGVPIIRRADSDLNQYELGPDLLVAPILSDDDERKVSFPAGDFWYDYWADDAFHDGNQTRTVRSTLSQIPLYIRSGAVIPIRVEDPETGHGDAGSAARLTVLVYPRGESVREYHPTPDQTVTVRSQRSGANGRLSISAQSERYMVRIKEPGTPTDIVLNRGGHAVPLQHFTRWEEFQAADEGTFRQDERNYLWARFATEESDADLTYRTLETD
jgi:alpha-glucosidase (family GH31 glycosyl hydrolase)